MNGQERGIDRVQAYGRAALRLASGGEEASAEGKAALRAAWEALAYPPLDWLGEAFALQEFERHCVLLALLPELDSGFGDQYARLQPGGAPDLTGGLALRLWPWGERSQYRELLAGHAPLARYFFEPPRQEDGPELRIPLRLCGEMRAFLLEQPGEEGPFSLWEPTEPVEDIYPDDRKCRDMLAYLERRSDAPVVFFLYGPEGAGKRLHVRRFAHLGGQPVLFVPAATIPADEHLAAAHCDRIVRAAVLGQSVVCVTELDTLLDDESPRPEAVYALLDAGLRVARVVFATARQEWRPRRLPAGCGFLPVELPMPGWAARGRLWRRFGEAYRVDRGVNLDELANKFAFAPGQIQGAIRFAANAAAWRGRDTIGPDELRQGCYSQIDGGMGGRAVRVNAAYSWEELILPEDSKALLRTACEQVKHRHIVYNQWGFEKKLAYGRSLSMLFSGPPGTGKTMGAQVIAAELGLELYKVDLSGVVSKYIGETEKNLQQVFNAAAQSQSVLFFDEADSLFAKRTEIKDSNDRYGNMEAAFLLQKMEEYDGICVLATNYAANFDDAFKRRIKFIIHFPFPSAHYREKLWRAMFPPQTPVAEDIDWGFLAERFELAGGNIKNIVVNAAFIAAGRGGPVGMGSLLRALRMEMAKSGKVLSREDLGEYYMLL